MFKISIHFSMNRSLKGILLLGSIFWVGSLLANDSRLPREASNWLSNSGSSANGDRDRMNVIFFEIPETHTQTIYFAVNDPGADNTSPDQGQGGTSRFTLMGGAGALSDPNSRLVDYSADRTVAYVGTNLDDYTVTTGSNSWVYFNGVLPSQGEKIGNKYYFKVVVQVDNNGKKDSYQLDASSANTGSPTGISGAKAFAYSWCIVPMNGNNTWDLYPYVPDDATNNLRVHNFDFDNGEEGFIYNVSGTNVGAFNPSGDSVTLTQNFAIGTERGASWRVRIQDNASGVAINTSEFWASNSATSENYRVYSSAISAVAADRVIMQLTDGTAVGNGSDTETIVLQIVGSSGTPLLSKRKIFVNADNSGLITLSNNGVVNAAATVVTTDSFGMGFIKVAKATTGLVNITLSTDGSNGSDNFGVGVDDIATINFATNVAPTLTAAANQTFPLTGASTAIPVLMIQDSTFASNISAVNDLYLQIPSDFYATWDSTITTITVGGSAAANVSSTVSYVSGKIIRISVSADFSAGQNLTISGLRLQNFSTGSTGRLLLSVDGGISYPVQDSKVFSVYDISPPTITSIETVDSNNNGYINSLRVTFSEPVKDISINYLHFSLSSAGGLSISGFSTDTASNDNVILLNFSDSVLHSGLTPTLNYSSTSLTDLSGNALSSFSQISTDKAPAVVLQVIAAAGIGDNILRVFFSEPVDANGGTMQANMNLSMFTYIDASNGAATLLTTITDNDASTDQEIRFTLNNGLSALDILNDRLRLIAGQVYDAAMNTSALTDLIITNGNPAQNIVATLESSNSNSIRVGDFLVLKIRLTRVDQSNFDDSLVFLQNPGIIKFYNEATSENVSQSFVFSQAQYLGQGQWQISFVASRNQFLSTAYYFVLSGNIGLGNTILSLDSREIPGNKGYYYIYDQMLLHQNYPNPFNPFREKTVIRFDITDGSQSALQLQIYSSNGLLVKTFSNAEIIGNNKVFWGGENNSGQRVASGVYYCVITTSSFQQKIKIALVR